MLCRMRALRETVMLNESGTTEVSAFVSRRICGRRKPFLSLLSQRLREHSQIQYTEVLFYEIIVFYIGLSRFHMD